MSRPRSRFWKSFMHPANLMWLGAAGTHAIIANEGMVALVAAGLEGVYLLGSGIAANRRPTKVVSRDSEAERRLEALMADLSPSQRQQAEALRDLKGHILNNYRKLPGGKLVAINSEARLDALLTSFVRLLGSLNNYRAHLSNAPRKTVEAELKELRDGMRETSNPRLNEVKAKRVEILEKRLARFQLAEESREVVSHQLAAIEDLLRLTLEQSISIRDPSSAAQQLEALSAGVESSEETVREMERIMEIGGEELFLTGIAEPERVR